MTETAGMIAIAEIIAITGIAGITTGTAEIAIVPLALATAAIVTTAAMTDSVTRNNRGDGEAAVAAATSKIAAMILPIPNAAQAPKPVRAARQAGANPMPAVTATTATAKTAIRQTARPTRDVAGMPAAMRRTTAKVTVRATARMIARQVAADRALPGVVMAGGEVVNAHCWW